MDICFGLFGSSRVLSTMCAPLFDKLVVLGWSGIASGIIVEPDVVGLRRELRSSACTNADNRSVALAR